MMDPVFLERIGVMNKSMRLLVPVMGALLISASAALADELSCWVGREVDDNKTHWTCTNSSGDNWTLKRNGNDKGAYSTVARTTEYIELQAKDTTSFDRVRLYKDKMTMNVNGAKFRWVKMATGKFHK